MPRSDTTATEQTYSGASIGENALLVNSGSGPIRDAGASPICWLRMHREEAYSSNARPHATIRPTAYSHQIAG